MSHDRRLYPATDQPLPSADDTGYPTQTTHEHESPTGRLWHSYAAYDERQPGFTDEPRSPLSTTSVYASGQELWSLQRELSSLPSFLDLETPSSAPQYTNDVAIDQQDLYPPHLESAEDWSENISDPASQALQQHDHHWEEMSNLTVRPLDPAQLDFGLFDNAYQRTLREGSNRHSAQTQNQEPPWPYYVNQQPPESMHGSGVFVTPNSAQQLGDNEDFRSFGQIKPMDIAAPDTSSPAGFHTLWCPSCPATFEGLYRKGNLARHRRLKHKGPVVYECEDDHCDRVFHRQDARLKHYRTWHHHLASGPAFRRRSHQNQSDYNIGSDTHEAGDARLETLSSMSQPQYADSTVYMDTTPSTPTIVTSGPSTEALRKDGENVRCDICQKGFNRAAELRRHKDSVHNLNPPQYFCAVPGCDRASRPFPRKDKLADHTARIHGQSTTSKAFEHGEEVSEATYRCDYEGCEREFDQRADLLRHQRTHTDESERPHKCTQCEKSFLYPKDLKRHQATHLDNEDDGKPTFHCEVASCEYGPGKQGFSRKDGMLRHMRRFHPELKREAPEDFGNEPGGPFQDAKRARAISTDQEPEPTIVTQPIKAALRTNRRTGCPGQDWKCKPKELKGRRYWTSFNQFCRHFLMYHSGDYLDKGYRSQCNLCDHDSFGASGHDLARHLWDTHLQ
ncbi:hypothetical protein AA0117_g10169 [Alternaria alternata]|uniref:C2H2-type domain-containing protein n=2 Tax=Alternaria sect. Alternaria TaxID=2499237 RepID=A0A4Q4N4U4_ALTAL|nr:hypothetical protein AA0117_g10169 [Alternaria alternata]